MRAKNCNKTLRMPLRNTLVFHVDINKTASFGKTTNLLHLYNIHLRLLSFGFRSESLDRWRSTMVGLIRLIQSLAFSGRDHRAI